MARSKTFAADLVFSIGSRYRHAKVRLPEERGKMAEVLKEKVQHHREPQESFVGALYKGRWID